MNFKKIIISLLTLILILPCSLTFAIENNTNNLNINSESAILLDEDTRYDFIF